MTYVPRRRTASETAHAATAVPLVPDLIKFDPVARVADDRLAIARDPLNRFVGNRIAAAVVKTVAVIENDKREIRPKKTRKAIVYPTAQLRFSFLVSHPEELL